MHLGDMHRDSSFQSHGDLDKSFLYVPPPLILIIQHIEKDYYNRKESLGSGGKDYLPEGIERLPASAGTDRSDNNGTERTVQCPVPGVRVYQPEDQ